MEPGQQSSASSAESPQTQAGLKSKYSPGNPAVRPLYSVTSVADFKTIFVDLVKTHRAIYELQGFLGNLSHSNVMFTNTSEPRAVLVSLDHPLQMPTGNDQCIRKRDAPIEHPFLSLDHISSYMSQAQTLDYLYRHHLESFVYILLYCAQQYATLPAHPSQPSDMYGNYILSDWFERYASCGHRTKNLMFKSENFRESLLQGAFQQGLGVDPEIQLWLRGLLQIFKDVTTTKYAPQKSPVEWGCATLNGSVTFEEFMAVLAGRGRVIMTDRSCAPRNEISDVYRYLLSGLAASRRNS